MDVRAIMSTDLVTVTREKSLQETVTRMLDDRVGSVIVVEGSEPVGIVTETDVLAVGTTYGRPFEEIPVTRAMSVNPVTVDPETSLEAAIEVLHDHGIKKLPVVEDDELVGVVTMTDFVYHQHDLATEAARLERDRTGPLEDTDRHE
ncbi:MAG: CBS domain-containing protein [Halobacteriota archaeon]